MQQQPALPTQGLLLLLLFSLAVWFGPLDYRKLIKPDEGRYAEIAREMAVSGDWLTPRLNGIQYFEKPPLQYWATAAAFKVFGFHDWAARLWTALTGFATVLLVYWAGRRLFGPAAGLYAGMVLISSAYFLLLGHVSTLDMGLTFFTTLALTGFSCAEWEGAGERERKWGMLTAWIAMALAVLSKGLIGVVLPAVTLALYALINRDWRIWQRLYLLPGGLIFLAIAAPWFIAVSVHNPGFAWFFFIHEHLLRYATPGARREGPVYYFVGILLIGSLPWIGVMLDSLWATMRRRKAPDKIDRSTLILLIWIIFVFVFFSVSSSKLPAYILPIFPALALLMGKRLAELEARQLTARILPVGVLLLVGFFFLADAASYASDAAARLLYQRYGYWLQVAAALMLAGVVYCCWMARQRCKPAALTGLAVAGLLSAQVAGTGHETLAPAHSAYYLAQAVKPHIKVDIPFYSVKMYDQTLPFYLRRTLTLVDYRDEFAFGIDQEPRLALSMDDFSLRWKTNTQALAVMQPELFEQLRKQGYDMEIIAKDSRRVVVKNHKDNK